MVQMRKRIMGFADHTDVDAALAQREQGAVQREHDTAKAACTPIDIFMPLGDVCMLFEE